MCEDHLYLALLAVRWLDPANFAKGPAQFFDAAPFLIRPIVRSFVRRKVERNLIAQGFGRHSKDEIATLAIRDIDALATLLGDKDFLMGAKPCAADAAVGAFVAHILAPAFDTPIRTAAECRANLVAYRDRIMQRYFRDAPLAERVAPADAAAASEDLGSTDPKIVNPAEVLRFGGACSAPLTSKTRKYRLRGSRHSPLSCR